VKDGVTLEFTITTTKDKEFEEVLKLISDQWQKIGVRVKVDIIDTSNAASSFVQNVIQGRNFDILLYKLVIGADPDVFAYWHSSQTSATGRNLSNYSSPLADASLSSARARLEPDLRNAKYKQFVKQWIDDAPAIALYQPVIEYVTAPNVSSVSEGGHLVTGVDRYANVQYWTVENELVYKTP
jgi:peptide/nickel transport system substrate-binding protein